MFYLISLISKRCGFCCLSYRGFLARNVSTIPSLSQTFNYRRDTDASFRQSRTGLFDYSNLKDASDFKKAAESVFVACSAFLEEVHSTNRSRKIIQILDDISDNICCVADLAECIRHLHPDRNFAIAAEHCLQMMHKLVEQLNTNYDLYSKTKLTLTDGDVLPLTSCDRHVTQLLLQDFEYSGVCLSVGERERFVDLTQLIFSLGTKYSLRCQAPSVVSKTNVSSDLCHYFQRQIENGCITLNSPLYELPESRARRFAYEIFYQLNLEQEQCLKQLVRTRKELASLTGFKSFAHRSLQRTLIGTPEAAEEFLLQLAEKLAPRAKQDHDVLLKELQKTDASVNCLQLWDAPYAAYKVKNDRFGDVQQMVKSYLSLGECMEGLNNLLSSIFGVQLIADQPIPGEVWHESVFKLIVKHETMGSIGKIYLDLCSRDGKPGDCHFTIRGGRRLAYKNDDCYEYQIPIVCLNFNFLSRKTSGENFGVIMLSLPQVENLFHEMGHAMHSVLGRTQYQHVTGTRCPTDFAEVPSNLLEYFLYDSKVLRNVALHFSTKKKLPIDAVDDLCRSRCVFDAHETQNQVQLALFDLYLHNNKFDEAKSTSSLMADVKSVVGGLPSVPNTAWHHRFSHLVVYGSKYYSYLVARAVASLLWQNLFYKDPFSRTAGELYKNELLAHGGEQPPQELLHNILGWRPTIKDMVNALINELDNVNVIN